MSLQGYRKSLHGPDRNMSGVDVETAILPSDTIWTTHCSLKSTGNCSLIELMYQPQLSNLMCLCNVYVYTIYWKSSTGLPYPTLLLWQYSLMSFLTFCLTLTNLYKHNLTLKTRAVKNNFLERADHFSSYKMCNYYRRSQWKRSRWKSDHCDGNSSSNVFEERCPVL